MFVAWVLNLVLQWVLQPVYKCAIVAWLCIITGVSLSVCPITAAIITTWIYCGMLLAGFIDLVMKKEAENNQDKLSRIKVAY
eukprot:8442490-Ditylum_brightwellii.AAC.1